MLVGSVSCLLVVWSSAVSADGSVTWQETLDTLALLRVPESISNLLKLRQKSQFDTIPMDDALQV